jgi:hypothetical protein
MKKKIATTLVAGALTLSGISLAACEVPEDTSKGSGSGQGVSKGLGTKDALKDVKLGKLTTPYGNVEIPVKVTNHSSKASDYSIEATVYDAQGNQVDTATTYIQRVAPGGTASDKLLGMNGQNAESYKLTVVDRTASY